VAGAPDREAEDAAGDDRFLGEVPAEQDDVVAGDGEDREAVLRLLDAHRVLLDEMAGRIGAADTASHGCSRTPRATSATSRSRAVAAG
jgi:hypothetical protein